MKPAIILALAVTSLSAQTTWQGLRFGMKLEEVKEHLKSKNLEVSQGRGYEAFRVSPNFELDIPDSTRTLNFTPTLNIGAKGLDIVTLTLDFSSYNLSVQTVLSEAAGPLYNQLVSKYGRPVRESGSCAEVSITSMLIGSKSYPKCEAAWSGEKQSVVLYWAYAGTRDSFLLIEYKPQVEGL